MRNRIVALFILLAPLPALLINSCASNGNNPVSPPKNTPTVTHSPTVTFTPTITNSPTITSSPTVTNSPTVTSTPTVTFTPTTTFTMCVAPVTCGGFASNDFSAGSTVGFLTTGSYSLGTGGILHSMSFATSGSAGQARVGIYTAASPPSLIVQSDPVSLTVDSNPITYTFTMPATLLPAATYYLVALTEGDGVDTRLSFGNYSTSSWLYYGSYPWGSMPATLDMSSLTGDGGIAQNIQAAFCP